jgi:hypothetical protein
MAHNNKNNKNNDRTISSPHAAAASCGRACGWLIGAMGWTYCRLLPRRAPTGQARTNEFVTGAPAFVDSSFGRYQYEPIGFGFISSTLALAS